MEQLPPVLALLVLFVVLLGLMYLGWRLRARHQGDLPPLPTPIAGGKALAYGGAGEGHFAGIYVTTTYADQPLERVTARGLGPRSRVSLTDATDGTRPVLLVHRQTASEFIIPWADVESVHTVPGMVGKWIGGDGLVVVRWRLGDALLDTGFRLDAAEDQAELLALGATYADPPQPTPHAPLPPSPDTPAPQPRKELP